MFLAKLLMPLGGLDKPLVRALAQRAGTPVFSKPDSQEICFVPQGDHGEIVEKAGGPMPGGELVHIGGQKLRDHDGIHRFTIGQRRGIGVGTGEKLYVVDIDPESQKVVMGPQEQLDVTKIKAEPIRAAVPLTVWPKTVEVQIRARHTPQRATWTADESGGLIFRFESSVQAVALGQAAVVYDGDVLLGGGMIVERMDGAFARKAPERKSIANVLENA
jgi:tRNA-specific 2-thiouridylase